MKKLLILLCSILLFSCNNDNDNIEYTLKYVVFYPNYNDTCIVTNNKGYLWDCDRGNNFIKNGSYTSSNVYSGSAPYKILSYTNKVLKSSVR